MIIGEPLSQHNYLHNDEKFPPVGGEKCSQINHQNLACTNLYIILYVPIVHYCNRFVQKPCFESKPIPAVPYTNLHHLI